MAETKIENKHRSEIENILNRLKAADVQVDIEQKLTGSIDFSLEEEMIAFHRQMHVCYEQILNRKSNNIMVPYKSGADIYLDGVIQVTKTPAKIMGVPVGNHSYILKLQGYKDATGTVVITAEETSYVCVRLETKAIK